MFPGPLLPGTDDARRRAPWRGSETSKTAKKGKVKSATHSPAFGPLSSSPATEKKRSSILSGGLFSKRRQMNATAPPSLPGGVSTARYIEPSAEAIARGVDILQSIFPKWDPSALQMMLEANTYVMEETITSILRMEETDEESNTKREEVQSGFSLPYPVKNPLPDDFLRLPDDDGSLTDDLRSDDEREEDEMEDGGRTSEFMLDEALASGLTDDDTEEKSASIVAEGDDNSEKSSVFAEDDGTLYGRGFEQDSDALQDHVTPPVLDSETMRKSQKIVTDSMNQKFIPEELRNERPTISSILDTSNIDVIKRSKLNLSEAEERIRHREPHLVFELLSKASEIYRKGIISSHELDTLRSMILSKIQPTKMLMDMSMSINEMISDHEWHLLLLKAKGIRQALSVRIVNNVQKLTRSGHTEYMIRIVDVESGVVWFTKKRFKELYKLHRKLSRLSTRISECIFPARRNHGRVSSRELATERAPVLEAFLRTAATLVTPPPMTFLHSCALKHLQQFLDVPHEGILLRNRTQPISRELRVFVYHTVNDTTTPEGKACSKFLAKLRQNGVDPGKNLLEEVGTILDGVQEYMLEHRFDEMRTHVERLVKYHSAGGVTDEGRRNSYVSNLLTDDALTNNDRLQQLISDAIRHELEEKVCIPLMAQLTVYLKVKVQEKERQFRQRVFQLRGKPQSYFGIPVNKISMSSWRQVVESIRDIDDAFLPQDKMRKLVATAHHIHALHRAEKNMIKTERKRALSTPQSPPQPASIAITIPPELATVTNESVPAPPNPVPSSPESTQTSNDDDDVLSGDDFLPIFIYVIVHSDLEAPIMTQVLLNRLCDPEKRRSESGYYLATFEAALHHILSNEGFE